MEYVVDYRQVIGKTFIVEAKDEYEAKKKAIHDFIAGLIDLNELDFIDHFVRDCWPACGRELFPMLDELNINRNSD